VERNLRLLFTLTPAVGILLLLDAQKRFEEFEDNRTWQRELGFMADRSRPEGRIQKRSRAPWNAFLHKELGLQQINFILLAGVVALGWMIDFPMDPDAPRYTALLFAAVAAPLLIGMAPIAEERRLRVLEWQTLLPVPTGRMLLTRYGFGVALALAVSVPAWIGAAEHAGVTERLGFYREFWMLPLWCAYAVALGLMISSASASSATALLGMVGVGLLLLFVPGLLWRAYTFSTRTAAPPLLVVVLGITTFAAAFPVIFRNSRYAEPLSRCVHRLFGTLISCVAATALVTFVAFDRTWERLEPRPELGPPRFSAANYLGFLNGIADGAAVDDQGRLWRNAHPETFTRSGVWSVLFEQVGTDTDWKTVAGSSGRWVALKRDGTLWHRANEARLTVRKNRPVPAGFYKFPAELTQLPVGNDWAHIAGNGYRMLGIRNDGTLWHFSSPVSVSQIGSATDWTDAAITDTADFAVNRRGQLWWRGKLEPYGKAVETNELAKLPGLPEPVADISGNYSGLAIRLRSGKELLLPTRRWGWPFHGLSNRLHDWPPLHEWSDEYYTRLGSGWYPVLRKDGQLFSILGWPRREQSHCRLVPVDMAGRWIDYLEVGDDRYLGIKDDGSLWTFGHPTTRFLGRWIGRRIRPQRIGELFESKEIRVVQYP